VRFEAGFNVLYGASDTGKSFILDSIDYMLGGKGPLRDFPEREGYDRVLLGMLTTSGEEFTLQRSTSGGGFLMVEGLHEVAFRTKAQLSCASNMMNARTIIYRVSCLRKSDLPTSGFGATSSTKPTA
jgi:AAA15 family ATPase/GTPase